MLRIVNRNGKEKLIPINKVAQAVRLGLRTQYDKENKANEDSRKANPV